MTSIRTASAQPENREARLRLLIEADNFATFQIEFSEYNGKSITLNHTEETLDHPLAKLAHRLGRKRFLDHMYRVIEAYYENKHATKYGYDRSNRTLLHWMIHLHQNEEAVARYIEEYDFYEHTTSRTSSHSITTMQDVILAQNITLLQRLIAAEPRLLEKTRHNKAPLLFAARYGNDAAVSELLRLGAKVEGDSLNEDQPERTPLHEAAERGSFACLELLLQAGAKPNRTCVSGFSVFSPLELVFKSAADPLEKKKCVELLLPVSRFEYKVNAIYIAAHQGDDQSIISLATQDPTLLTQDEGGITNILVKSSPTGKIAEKFPEKHELLCYLTNLNSAHHQRSLQYTTYYRNNAPATRALLKAGMLADNETVNWLPNNFNLELKAWMQLTAYVLNCREEVKSPSAFEFFWNKVSYPPSQRLAVAEKLMQIVIHDNRDLRFTTEDIKVLTY